MSAIGKVVIAAALASRTGSEARFPFPSNQRQTRDDRATNFSKRFGHSQA
jgi:hypothetical protein